MSAHLPHPWMLTRLHRVDDSEELLQALDSAIRTDMALCTRCTSIYEQTGLVPVECDQCEAQRDDAWILEIERRAKLLLKQPKLVIYKQVHNWRILRDNQ